jgi:hypothetical protein
LDIIERDSISLFFIRKSLKTSCKKSKHYKVQFVNYSGFSLNNVTASLDKNRSTFSLDQLAQTNHLLFDFDGGEIVNPLDMNISIESFIDSNLINRSYQKRSILKRSDLSHNELNVVQIQYESSQFPNGPFFIFIKQ